MLIDHQVESVEAKHPSGQVTVSITIFNRLSQENDGINHHAEYFPSWGLGEQPIPQGLCEERIS